MINIADVCKDGKAKYYAAVLFDNAATTLFAGTLTESAIETPSGPLVIYNVYKSDNYQRMEADPSLPKSLKSKLRKYGPNLEDEFTSPSLEGLHVLRTPTPLAGQQLRKTLTIIQKTLESQFFSKSQGRFGTVRDSLVMEKVYRG